LAPENEFGAVLRTPAGRGLAREVSGYRCVKA